MNSATLGHFLAIMMMRTSESIEEVREIGRVYALKFVNISRALNEAREEVLRTAEPEEIATIERVFDTFAKYEAEYTAESFKDYKDFLDSDGEV